MQTPLANSRVVVAITILVASFVAYSQDGPVSAPTKALRLQPATLGYADEDEITPGCVGALQLTSSTFLFEDHDDCWSGPEIDVSLSDVEWIKYEAWDAGTSLELRAKTIKRPLLLGLTTIRAEKMYRHFRKYSSVTNQRCSVGSMNARFEKTITPVSCDLWVGDK
jgi:hypothetical protein